LPFATLPRSGSKVKQIAVGAEKMNRSPSRRVCPRCGGSDCRRSRTRGPIERVGKLFGLKAWRCETCSRRFMGRATQPSWSERLVNEP
jgi:hypothetical protein